MTVELVGMESGPRAGGPRAGGPRAGGERRRAGGLSGGALDKYVAIAALAFRQRLEERAVLWGRVMFYGLILLIYARLWEAVLGGDGVVAALGGQAVADGALGDRALGDRALGQAPGSYVW